MGMIPGGEDLGRRIAEPVNLAGTTGRGWAGGAVTQAVVDIGRQVEAEDDHANFAGAEAALKLWEANALYGPKGAINRRGKDAEGVPKELDADFEQRRREIAGTLTSERQRQAFAVRAGALRADVQRWANRHALSERENFQSEQFAANMKSSIARAADHAYDPAIVGAEVNSARGLIAGWAQARGWSPEQTQEALREQLSATHGAVIDRFLAGDDWSSAERYLRANASQMDSRQVLRVQGVVKAAGTLGRAQEVADQIMAKGLPLDEAMRHIETNFSGETERAAKAEVASRFAYNEKARHDREQASYGTALLEVEQRGRVTPGIWAMLSDGHRAAILSRQQAEARQRAAEAAGRPVKTDFSLYLDLRQQAIDNPDAFARLDLKQYVDKIGGAQLEQLADLKGKVSNPKSQRDAVSLSQQMTATMQALNIRKPEAKGQFLSYVQAEVDDAAQAKGKALTFDERQQIIDRAVLKGPDPDAWLWGEKRLFQLTPEQRQRFRPNAATDAPATEVDALNEALKAQGLPQTPANRLRLYQRTMSRTQ